MASESSVRLDERLPELVAGILDRVATDPPETMARLRPPRLRVVLGTDRGVNSFCVRAGENVVVLVGGAVYDFLHRYTTAAATFFLPSSEDGPRPSPEWQEARGALATTLDWLCIPALEPRFPVIATTDNQEQAARTFGDYAFRFSLCHELAHVVLEHVDAATTEPRIVAGDQTEVLRASQANEEAADRLGLQLQVKSLPNPSQLVNGLVSGIYFVHAAELIVAKLSLVADLVDYEAWKVRYSHPPMLARILALAGQANGYMVGAGDGVLKVHHALQELDAAVMDRANRQGDEVAGAVRDLVNAEAARPSGRSPLEEVVEHLARSPTGVLRGLEPDQTTRPQGRAIQDDIAATLPGELQDYRAATREQRATFA
jgi:hypothetical protein